VKIDDVAEISREKKIELNALIEKNQKTETRLD